MNDHNTLARFATPTNLMVGRSYLGRIRVDTIDGATASIAGIDLYDSTSLDISEPFMTVGVGDSYGGPTDSAADFRSGATVDGLFCVVEVGPGGNISTTFNGIHFAWFRHFETQPPQWRMVANGGLVNVIVCPEEFVTCSPFAFPFGWKVCDEGEFGFQYPLKPNQPAFVSSVGTEGLPEGWRLEYQACNPDDPNNDATPGIRSPWNFLAANCCSTSVGGDDDDGTGDGDDDEETGGGGGGGDDEARCDELGFLCALVVRECFDANGVAFNKWCLIDDRMGCWIHSGRRCFCDTRLDINGDPIPNPNTLPPGTVIITGCGAPGAIPPCSELPEDQNDPEPYHCPPP